MTAALSISDTRDVDGVNILAFVTDAHGGFGGIAQYNRDVLQALSSWESVERVSVLPRLMQAEPGMLPDKLEYDTNGLNGRISYTLACLRRAVGHRGVDLLLCGHINLLPVAYAASKVLRVPLALLVFGIDVWMPPKGKISAALASRASLVISISQLTLDRFRSWCPIQRGQAVVVPNAIHLEQYGVSKPSAELRKRLGLSDRRVILTLGRMADGERYKGFDEVIQILPELLTQVPDLVYVAAGDGRDLPRLKAKVSQLGLQNSVVFPGRISDEDKADLFRLADAFVMPSRGEGFGFVILEALACGVPVVASKADGTKEALRNGELGILVDPGSPAEIVSGIVAALQRPKAVPAGLEHFAFPQFSSRLRAAIRNVCPV